MKRYSKLLVAVAGALVQIANMNIFHGTAEHLVSVAGGLATAVAVYVVSNGQIPGPTDPAVVINS
jgi:ABC-type enterobactin transport system permease subunit